MKEFCNRTDQKLRNRVPMKLYKVDKVTLIAERKESFRYL